MTSHKRSKSIMPSALEPIAIVGIGCRFPGGANSPESFWQLLVEGIDAVTEVPSDRWNLETFYHPDPNQPGKTYARYGGFIDNIDQFDAHFFGISPREAARMDPQQRLALEVAWETLEDGGLVPDQLSGQAVGVFMGISGSDYQHIQSRDTASMNAYTNLGNAHCIVPNRISYSFNFTGPSLAVDTACSSALVAVHLACQSIWTGETVMALAGGSNLLLLPEPTIGFSKASMLSPDGRCKSFDARANGYVRSEGLGLVALQPLSQALADGNRIYAVIRSSAVNEDGRTTGITVPGSAAQEAILRDAYRRANLSPAQVVYVEAHGTGTPIGDPIEVKALGAVVGQSRPMGHECLIGSVKTNIGHGETVAGIAGLIKAALIVYHGQVPPSLHFETPNPEISFDSLGLRVATQLQVLPKNGSAARLVGVNAFSFGGVNAHTVLAEPPLTAEVPAEIAPPYLLPLSASSPEALQAAAQAFLDHTPAAPLADIGYTAGLRRTHHDYRLTVVADSRDDLIAQLRAYLDGETRRTILQGRQQTGTTPRPVFVFSGMGQQWWAMGRQLLETEPVFQEVIRQCDRLFQPYTGWSLWAELMADEDDSRIQQTAVAQPAIFSLQVALTALWRSWGVVPAAIVGHSVGEVAAAHVAGVLTLEEAVRLTFQRSRLQATTAGQGSMLAVGLSAEAVQPYIAAYTNRVSIAAINSPSAVTLSGEMAALQQIAETLAETQVFARLLNVEVPYHSPLMDSLKPDLEAALADLRPQPATVALFSTVTGQAIDGSEMDATYWGRNMREPVYFAAAIKALAAQEYTLFLEIGAHPVLSSSVLECLAPNQSAVLASLRRRESERAQLLMTFGQLYVRGYPVDWSALYPHRGQLVRLPAYSWQHERFWNESAESMQQRLARPDHPLLGRRLNAPQATWAGELDRLRYGYLQDHVIQGAVVYPGAAYVEMVLAAAHQLFGAGVYILEESHIYNALVLQEGEIFTTQVVLSADGTSGRIYSHPAQARQQPWVDHASGKLRYEPDGYAPTALPPAEIRGHFPFEITQAASYQKMKEMGADYGPAFQGIAHIWYSETEGLFEIQTPEIIHPDLAAYHIHPALLDACFQGTLVAFIDDRRTWLPIGIDRLRFYASPGLRVWGHVRVVKRSANYFQADLQMLDETGTVLLDITGLRYQAIRQTRAAAISPTDHLYQYRWQWQPYAGQPARRRADYLPAPTSLEITARQPRYYQEIRPQLEALTAAYIRQAGRNGTPLETQIAQQPVLTRLLTNHQETDLDPITTWQRLLTQYPDYQTELHLLAQSEPVLHGHLEPPELTDNGLLQDAPTSRVYNDLIRQAVQTALAHLPSDQTLRILAIGSTGLTASLLPHLPARQIEYVLTGLTEASLEQAQQKFARYAFVHYQLLDPTAAPVEQGLEAHTFDLILAGNALATSPDRRQTLTHLKQLLAGQGWLLLQEMVNPPLWFDLFISLRTMTVESPFLSGAEWAALLAEVGFQNVAELADGAATEQTVVLAQGPAIESPRAALPPTEPATWLIFADRGGVADKLTHLIEQTAGRPILAFSGDDYDQPTADRFRLRPDQPDDIQRLLAAVGPEVSNWRGVLHLWSLDTPPTAEMTAASLEAAQHLGSLSVLYLVQALLGRGLTPPLWLITPGQEQVLAQTPVWGLRRVIANEQPRLQPRLVELGGLDREAEIQGLWAELWADDAEDEIAWRGTERYVHRLQRIPPADLTAKQLDNPAFRLQQTRPGDPESLRLQPLERQWPGPGQVEIEIHAAALNFKDIVKSMHMIDELSLTKTYFGQALGLECAGIVVAVGEGVTDFQAGDEVIALAPHAFSSHTLADARFVAPKPDYLSFEEAATIPLVFSTAYAALCYFGRIQARDRILIHAAAGGVGQAAIQVAQQVGAEIFATAGSFQKRDFLRLQGVEHVMDSRSLNFADEIMARTGGQGVDIVLNSLPGQTIAKSLSTLRPLGRFIDLSNIYGDSQVDLKPFQKGLALFAFDLDQLMRTDPDYSGAMFQESIQYFVKHRMPALPYRLFSISAAGQAFRHMTQAKHIGKIVLSMREPVTLYPDKAITLRTEGTYLVIGGLSGFGLALARWLAQRGAGHLVVVSRRGAASAEAQAAVETLRQTGVNVVVMQADVSRAADVARVLAEIKQTLPPLYGVVHAAAVYDDGTLPQLSRNRLEQVLAPKMLGAWHLHHHTQAMPLDFFVLFSSISSLIGNPGQGNYAAANAFLDALAWQRRRQGLPALTINWGPIADAGHVARNSQVAAHLGQMGLQALSADQALAIFELLLQREAAQIAVSPVNWAQLGQFPTAASPRLKHILTQTAGGEAGIEMGSLRELWQAAAPDERLELIQARLSEQVARVLAISVERLDINHVLTDLGLDSLMATELSHRLSQVSGFEISTMQLLGGVSLAQLAAQINDQLGAVITTDDKVEPKLDLQAEAVLDETIIPGGDPAATEPANLLLTGATGFVGAFLLHELLQRTTAQINCLVRGDDPAVGSNRLRAAFEAYGLPYNDEVAARIRVIPGDLGRPLFGLSPAQFDALAEAVDVIYHNGAWVNFALPYPTLKPINTSGTHEILRLAARGKSKAVHYTSTLSIFANSYFTADDQTIYEDVNIDPYQQGLPGGYFQSKWVAEKLVMAARDRGLPISIYRLGRIGGHSQTGVWKTDDFPCRMIKGCLQLGLAPDLNNHYDLTPVDYASQAIAHLSQQTPGQTFHLPARQPVTWPDMVRWLQAFGYPLATVAFETWRASLAENPHNVLYPLLALFDDATTTAREPKFDTRNTLDRLAGTAIACPIVDQPMFDNYLRHFIKIGFLMRPTLSEES